MTSLACWTLSSAARLPQVVAAGLNWLCEDWPRDSSRGSACFGNSLLNATFSQLMILIEDGAGPPTQVAGWSPRLCVACLGTSSRRTWFLLRRRDAESLPNPCSATACVQMAAGIAAIPECTALQANRSSSPQSGPCWHCVPARNDVKTSISLDWLEPKHRKIQRPCLPGSHKDLFR